MLQNSYGWTDDVILNLTLRRAVQMKEAIEQRTEFRSWEDRKLREWETQSLAMMIANSVENKKAREQLVQLAKDISLTKNADTNKRQAPTRTTYKTVDGKEISPKELKEYSYEEIDHTAHVEKVTASARTKNAGMDLTQLMSGFTRG